MLETVITEAKKLLNDKVIATLKEQGPKVAFTKLHMMLPFAVRMLVKEETFVTFCLDNQHKIFGSSAPVVLKKAPAKKVAVKKAPAKKVAVKKAPAKKVAVKKVVAKKVSPKIK